jgi:hypothetical protein
VIWAHLLLTGITAAICVYTVFTVRSCNEKLLNQLKGFLIDAVNSRPVIHYEDWSGNGHH